MKRLLLIPLAFILIAGLVLAGCAEPSPTPSPAPAPEPAPMEPIKLKWVLPVPPESVFNGGMLIPWSEMVTERTTAVGTPVEVTFFYGESLTQFGQEIPSLKAGVMDGVSMMMPARFDASGGIASVLQLPFLYKSTMAAAQTGLALAEKYPDAFAAQYADVKLMWFQPPAPSASLFATDKQLKTLEDIQGLKTWAEGKYLTEAIQTLGATPVGINIIDVFTYLERGGLDFVAQNWEACMAFKWFEVTGYRTDLPRGIQSLFHASVMGHDSWNKLPPEVQKIFDELNGRFMTELAANSFDGANGQLRGVISGIDAEKGNPPVYEVPDEAFQKWVEAAQPVYDTWINDMQGQAFDPAAVVADVRALAGQYAQ